MITKQQWLEAIQQTRELWKGVQRYKDIFFDEMRNGNFKKLGVTSTCPFCLLVQEKCHLCIAIPKKFTDEPHPCYPYLKSIKAADDLEKRAMEILNDIEINLDEIMEAIEHEIYI